MFCLPLKFHFPWGSNLFLAYRDVGKHTDSIIVDSFFFDPVGWVQETKMEVLRSTRKPTGNNRMGRRGWGARD